MLLTIEDTQESLYSALKELGDGWFSRMDIAHQIGKKQLNPIEFAALDLLVKDGRIEKVIQQAGRGNVTKFVYRVKE